MRRTKRRIHVAVMKSSREYANSKGSLEEKLADSNKRFVQLGMENTHFAKPFSTKETIIGSLNDQKARAEADFITLMTRLESLERENASLKYEIRVLEKELEIRNEEREFNRQTADVAHKQNLESMKRIAKLESECQKLRILVRKQLPGPASLAKMKNEVELLGKDPFETRMRRSNPFRPGQTGFPKDIAHDSSSKRISLLTEQKYAMEEENRTLKEILNKRTDDPQLHKLICERAAPNLSKLVEQFKELSRYQTAVGTSRDLSNSLELSLVSMSDGGSDDKVSCGESWVSALISELEHFKHVRQAGRPSYRTVGSSDINLMDDFVEMEKLAIVSMDKSHKGSQGALRRGTESNGPFETQSCDSSSKSTGREVILLPSCEVDFSVANPEMQSKDFKTSKFPGWVGDIAKVILEENHATQRSCNDIIEDIKAAVGHMNPNALGHNNAKERTSDPDACSSNMDGYVTWKSPDGSPLVISSNTLTESRMFLPETNCQNDQPKLSVSIKKLIELINGIGMSSPDDGISEMLGNPETPTGYIVRVFQWKTYDLGAVLKQFVQTCDDFLNGIVGIEKFAEELASDFEWIMNHCFSIQDVSSMKDEFRKQFDWDESGSDSEVEGGMIDHPPIDTLHASEELSSQLPIVAEWNSSNNCLFQMEELPPDCAERNVTLKDEPLNMKLEKKGMEDITKSEMGQNEFMMVQLRESDKTISSLRAGVEALKQSNGMMESHKPVEEDFDAQHELAKVEPDGVCQKVASLDGEERNKNKICEDRKATTQSAAKESLTYDMEKDDHQLQTDWEITAASEKLAECQETILNLGRQLKALAASPKDAAIFDKVISITPDGSSPIVIGNPTRKRTPRSSLLDRMLAEDNAEADSKSPKTKEIILDGSSVTYPKAAGVPKTVLTRNEIKRQEDEVLAVSLAIVSKKKKGIGGILKRIWLRSRACNDKKMPHPFT